MKVRTHQISGGPLELLRDTERGPELIGTLECDDETIDVVVGALNEAETGRGYAHRVVRVLGLDVPLVVRTREEADALAQIDDELWTTARAHLEQGAASVTFLPGDRESSPDEPEDSAARTARGFRIYAEFVDGHEHTVRVQESSAGEGAVWIFVHEPDGTEVKHWKAGGGWEPAPKPGTGDPPWKPGEPTRVMSEGWSSVSPHLSPENCRQLIAALEEHLDYIGEDGVGRC